MYEIGEFKELLSKSLVNDLYSQREDEICKITPQEKKQRKKIIEKYPTSYEKLLIAINNLPPHFCNTREQIIESLDNYAMRENLLAGYDNEKFYKIGFCDGVNLIIECLKNNQQS